MKRVQLKEKRVRIVEPERKPVFLNDDSLLPADYLARKIIIHSFLYYVMDKPVISDHEYDRLCAIVAKRWSELHPDRQWALGSPELIRSTGHHVKFSSAAVGAALNYHKYNTGELMVNFPDSIYKWRRNGTRFVTTAVPKPQRMAG